jgi:triacylglycerol lipase
VHIHGGGFVAGAPEMRDVLLASDLRCAIYSVNYRLAPEAPHPAPLEDIYSAFAWLHENSRKLGLDPARLGIKGESGAAVWLRPLRYTLATTRGQSSPFNT